MDAKLAAKITQETSSAAVEVVHDDFLNFRLPATPCVIVASDEALKKHNLTARARVVANSARGVRPEIMGTGFVAKEAAAKSART